MEDNVMLSLVDELADNTRLIELSHTGLIELSLQSIRQVTTTTDQQVLLVILQNPKTALEKLDLGWNAINNCKHY